MMTDKELMDEINQICIHQIANDGLKHARNAIRELARRLPAAEPEQMTPCPRCSEPGSLVYHIRGPNFPLRIPEGCVMANEPQPQPAPPPPRPTQTRGQAVAETFWLPISTSPDDALATLRRFIAAAVDAEIASATERAAKVAEGYSADYQQDGGTREGVKIAIAARIRAGEASA